MVIMFDPTSELLHSLNEPECIKRTKLKKLQETQVYVGSLLGKDPEESSDVSSDVVEDFLGFHLDSIMMSKDRTRGTAFPSTSQNEEIEIVFYREDKEKEEEEKPEDSESLGSIYVDDDGSEEVEIVFFACQVEEKGDGGDSISYYSSNDESASKYTDCRSNFTPLPSEWFLPQDPDEDILADRDIFADEDMDIDILSSFTPPYEWFHPDHVDVEPRKEKSTHNLLKLLMSSSPATPVTAASSHANSFDCNEPLDTSADDFLDVMSVGSGASEVVQDLLELCRA
jgi:hypothetical protein